MDISVLFSIGSFMVSEHVLKPKASVLVILGCVLAYDLTTKTHDVSSLRVYRAPGLLAFCLTMVAYSLRTWRRNGVACDELLFLPGTPHADHTIGGCNGDNNTNNDQQLPTTTTTGLPTTSQNSITNTTTTTAAAASTPSGTTTTTSRRSTSNSNNNNNNNNCDDEVLKTSSSSNNGKGGTNKKSLTPQHRLEGDVAAGLGPWNQNKKTKKSPAPSRDGSNMFTKSTTTTTITANNHNNNNNNLHQNQQQHQQRRQFRANSVHDIELVPLTEKLDQDASTARRSRSLSRDSTISSINEFDESHWDDDDDDVDPLGDSSNHNQDNDNNNNNNSNHNHNNNKKGDDNHNDVQTSFIGRGRRQNRRNNDMSDEENLMEPLKNGNDGILSSKFSDTDDTNEQNQSYDNNNNNNNNTNNNNNNNNNANLDIPSAGNRAMRAIRSHVVNDIREGQAQITRFGSFFFFRTTTTSTQNAVYAPSGPSVVGAALDLSMPTLINFHLFIQAWNHLSTADGSKNPAKILPMCFLTALTVRCFVPLGRRGRFWNTISCTMTAPFPRSRFRDSFVGDILTSLVRPLQDVAFAASYYLSGLFGVLSTKYDLSESGDMLEASWILHTVILPSCALLPLWWRFLQTLRESYDNGHRWPYLGNAFKYLSASVVIMYGMTHPEQRGSIQWMAVFFLALLYQIWWDTFMDWELFVIVPKSEDRLDPVSNTSCCPSISSVRPTSHLLLTFQRYVFNPVGEAIRCALVKIPSWKQFQIRPRRLYKTEAFYWKIFFFNTVFRFCWMLSFIPSYNLTAARRDRKEEFESDTDSYIGVLLPVAEIFRRTLWGMLVLEMQTIHMTDGDPNFRYSFSSSSLSQSNDLDGNNHNVDDDEEAEESESVLSIDSSKRNIHRPTTSFAPSWLINQLQIQDHVSAVHPQSSTFLVTMTTKITDFLNISTRTRNILFLFELCLWAIAFVVLGIWATSLPNNNNN